MVSKNEVTDIKVNVKRPDRRSIYVNGEFAFSISEGIFYDHGIKVSDTLTDEQIELLIASDEKQRIKDTVFNLLSYRQRSVKELRDRLHQKGWSERQYEPVIQKFKEKGLLNDKEFARMVARDRTKRKLLGPRALRNELQKAGIDRNIIEEVIEEAYYNNPPESLIKILLKKKGINFRKAIDKKERVRVINLLKRKGYSWDEMEPMISRLKTD